MRNRKALALSAVLVVGSLLGAACGSDGDDTASPTTQAATATTAPAAEVTTTTAAAAPPVTLNDGKTIVDVAVGAGSFNTLVAAVQAAGLVDVLKSAGPFTVFAPTDDAFANVPGVTIEALLKDTKVLAGVLTYHVVPGALKLSELKDGQMLDTAAGKQLEVRKDADGTVYVNNAKVVASDIEASNGVIHVVDSVIFLENV